MWLNIHCGSPPHTHPRNSLLRVLAAPLGSYPLSGRLVRQRGGAQGHEQLPGMLPPALALPPLLPPSELGRSLRTRAAVLDVGLACPRAEQEGFPQPGYSPTLAITLSSQFSYNSPCLQLGLAVQQTLKGFSGPAHTLYFNFLVQPPLPFSLLFHCCDSFCPIS